METDLKKDSIKTILNKEDNNHYCIFENRLCQYANKIGSCFSCEAPSDNQMTCK